MTDVIEDRMDTTPASAPGAVTRDQLTLPDERPSNQNADDNRYADRALTFLAGDERRRFVAGNILVPTMIAFSVLLVGTRLNTRYQDWQDRRTQAQDLVSAVRNTATVLSGHLDNLQRRGGALERIWSDQDALVHIQAVDESLAMMEGLARALSRAEFGFDGNESGLIPEISNCKAVVEIYSECLGEVLGAGENRRYGEDPCTQEFDRATSAPASCNSILVSAFSISSTNRFHTSPRTVANGIGWWPSSGVGPRCCG